ncbi:hypothetical protein DPMN_191303 [Dreissena polymorpha]|uniref:Uncharacterized protein n=1 Tax=Dreissena polymorpha TaxID=45954 RepID=A0A9D3Y0Y2_DREPO|nr:hypothetical protein DPMN_191303 [Dreissena polymorpha]
MQGPTRKLFGSLALYFTYAGTIFDIIPPSISFYGFADDHTASTRFKPILSEETEASTNSKHVHKK